MFSSRIANSMGASPDPQLPEPTGAQDAARVTEPGVDRQYSGRMPEAVVRAPLPDCYHAPNIETRMPMRFVGFTSRPSEGQAMATRQPFTGAHAVIGRNPTGFPVGAWAGNSQPNRLVFRRIPEAWDAGSENG